MTAPTSDDVAEVASALSAIARSIERLGMKDAIGPLGAIEGHTVKMVEVGEKIAESLDGIGEALMEVSNSLDRIALRMGGEP